MMRKSLLALLIVLLSGCSVHEVWNGDAKPGVAYISIDKQGAVTSNVKSASYLEDYLDNSDDTKSNKFLTRLLNDDNFRTTLFVWGADYNGAMINERGQTCLQAASYAKTQNIDVDVSDALLQLYTKIDLSKEEDKLLAIKITETLEKLQEQSKESTYLSVGLFGICLLCANGDLNDKQAAEAIQSLITASSLSVSSVKEGNGNAPSGSEPSRDESKEKTQDK